MLSIIITSLLLVKDWYQYSDYGNNNNWLIYLILIYNN